MLVNFNIADADLNVFRCQEKQKVLAISTA